MVRGNTQRESNDIMKKKIFITILFLNLFFTSSHAKNDLYEKIDLFGEVIENIKKDYVDDVDQSMVCFNH